MKDDRYIDLPEPKSKQYMYGMIAKKMIINPPGMGGLARKARREIMKKQRRISQKRSIGK